MISDSDLSSKLGRATTEEKVTLLIYVDDRSDRFDALMSQLAETRIPIISQNVQGFFFIVDSVFRRDTIATAKCRRFTLPYLEEALRAQRFTYDVQP